MTAIEKITEILKAYTKKHNITASSVILEEYAEELVANGVIMLPCKVGDIVYSITHNNRINKETITDITIFLDQYAPPYIECDTKCEVSGYFYNSYFDCNLFGKTVFLTKEEAEEKLKELKDG